MKFNPILKTHRIFWYFCPAKSIRKEYAGTRRGILSWAGHRGGRDLGYDIRFDEGVVDRRIVSRCDHVPALSDRLRGFEDGLSAKRTPGAVQRRTDVRRGGDYRRIDVFSDREHGATDHAGVECRVVADDFPDHDRSVVPSVLPGGRNRSAGPVVLGMLVALAGVALVVYNGNFILQIARGATC